jgi:hypothetical protein
MTMSQLRRKQRAANERRARELAFRTSILSHPSNKLLARRLKAAVLAR